MNTDDVWQLMEQARASLDSTASHDSDKLASQMAKLLSQRDLAEIVAFAQPLWDLLATSYRADLWAAAYIINGGASDDGFDYFRGWLLAQGRAVFEQALSNPDSLADLPGVISAQADGDCLECESMLSVAWNAHLAATGDELPQGAFKIQYPALDPDWDFDFDDDAEMRRRLPRLTRLHFDDAG